MKDSHITRGRVRPIKTVRESFKKDIEINELDRIMA